MAGAVGAPGRAVRELRAETLAEGAIAQEIAKFVGRSDVTEEVVGSAANEHWRALTDSPSLASKLDFQIRDESRRIMMGSWPRGPRCPK
jgi:K+-sensing histidine kinase KdpD